MQINRKEAKRDYIATEILINIFEYLTPKDLFNIFLVNKNFYQSSNDDYLW